MAHTYEQTLLAKLGFADPDRKNPLHDSVCRYITSPSGRVAIAQVCGPQDTNYKNGGNKHVCTYQITETEAERERPIAKGKGASRFLIGFLDAVIGVTYLREKTMERATGEVEKDMPQRIYKTFIVEVKINRESIGQILRQVNFYRDFIRTNFTNDFCDLIDYQFVLATRYKPTEEELETLYDANITHLLIGKGFDRYIAEQAVAEKTPRPPIKEV